MESKLKRVNFRKLLFTLLSYTLKALFCFSKQRFFFVEFIQLQIKCKKTA